MDATCLTSAKNMILVKLVHKTSRKCFTKKIEKKFIILKYRRYLWILIFCKKKKRSFAYSIHSLVHTDMIGMMPMMAAHVRRRRRRHWMLLLQLVLQQKRLLLLLLLHLPVAAALHEVAGGATPAADRGRRRVSRLLGRRGLLAG